MKEELIYKERRDTNCEKWDGLGRQFGQEKLLPMWVADMDFEVPKCVQKTLQSYVEHGVFGYYKEPSSYKEAFINWEKKRHSYIVEESWIRFTPGIVPALYWLIQAYSQVGEAVLTSTPVYPPFYSAVEDGKRRLIKAPLMNNNGIYTMNYELIEKEIIENQVKIYILCSPHNPVGRVWEHEELSRLLNICKKHQVIVLADEIHQDIIVGNKKQVPAASITEFDDIVVTLTAATKTFNLAACQNAFIIIKNEELRQKFDEFAKGIHLGQGNTFGYLAIQSAYEEGIPWLESAIERFRENYEYIRQYLQDHLPLATVAPLEGTYLVWVDLTAYLKGKDMKDIMQNTCGLGFSYGATFGGSAYEYFVRINVATKLEHIKEAMAMLVLE